MDVHEVRLAFPAAVLFEDAWGDPGCGDSGGTTVAGRARGELFDRTADGGGPRLEAGVGEGAGGYDDGHDGYNGHNELGGYDGIGVAARRTSSLLEQSGALGGLSVSFEDVAFVYPSRREAGRILDGFNLELKAGDHVGVIGSSGSGKSTLFRFLLTQPTHYDHPIGPTHSCTGPDHRS